MGMTPEARTLMASGQGRPWHTVSLREAMGLTASWEIAQNAHGCTR